MGELADRLSMIVVEAYSPDSGLVASVRGRGDVTVRFWQRSYRDYRAADLARQLEGLAAVVWARYRRSYLEVVRSWADRDEEPADTEQDHEFRRRLATVRVSGVSARGRVTVRSRALVAWEVEIAGEPVGSLTEPEFLAEVDSAVVALLADHRARVALLTDAVYDIGLPRSMRAGGRGAA
ncbi:hypothetical protein Aab01nite_31500 [Paractinoplanes abujensis]|uniref:Uncharacterized protein n=1 Tax=Paractinoplanes abujensis TaxID=882441 RepID=A0A7W7G6F1_9ACTN|nr:hypothetical protein [Actinoplanes abujensis]MBB4697957.1 hypothetical protein [Actinoplanes abujensis]GID19560.1 hypothetical protein Aab01nite_31500 [Actinoplanes abujensis]